jgi:REP element-mobilizing transposase RayT
MTNTDKFKGKYRIPSARWPAWDYGSNAAYFVTICTANRECIFGTIIGGNNILTPLGRSARDCWKEIPAHFPFVELGEFVVMPNHVHGIVIIKKPDEIGDGGGGFVETQNFASLRSTQPPPTKPQNQFGPQSKNLASIIRGYKIGVTKFARQNNISFAWQPRYHDHVIRNDEEYERIGYYIGTNVQNWAKDKFCSQQTDQSHNKKG